jgi:hypothetical protein
MPWVNIEVLVAQNLPSQKEVQQVLDYLSRKAKARFLAVHIWISAAPTRMFEKSWPRFR